MVICYIENYDKRQSKERKNCLGKAKQTESQHSSELCQIHKKKGLHIVAKKRKTQNRRESCVYAVDGSYYVVFDAF